MTESLQSVSQAKIEEIIGAIENCNLNDDKVTPEILKPFIESLFHKDFIIAINRIDPGQILYRGVKRLNQPTMGSEISYPPSDKVGDYGRGNRKKESRFYCCSGNSAPLFELDPKPGEYLAISQWEVKKEFLVFPLGYSEEVFKDYKSAKDISWCSWLNENPALKSPLNARIANFLAKKFAQVAGGGQNHIYKFSVALSECLTSKNMPEEIKNFAVGGVRYPSLAMAANDDNLMLFPETVDSCLRLKKILYVQMIKKIGIDYQCQVIDSASGFKNNGTVIDWNGLAEGW